MSLIPSGTTVTVETKWFPPLTVDVSGAGEGEPNRLTKLLKPKVTLKLKGQTLTSVAPAGEPFPNEWPRVKVALVVVGALAIFSLLRIFR